MSLFISKVINSAIQIILFALIPFIWWLVTARKECSFFEWIGLKRPRAGESDKPLLWVAGTSAVFLIVSLFVLYSVKNVETATSEFTGLSVNAIPAILVYAVFNTALPEEILFRGFLLKRIANKTGFAIGNMIQAVLFGLMHGVLFFSSVGTIKAILITRMAYGIYKRKENRRVNPPRLADPFDSQHLFGTKRSIRIIFVENR